MTNYSATVDILLIVGSHVLDVRQIGDRSLILANRMELETPQEATAVVTVDGTVTKYPVVVRNVSGRLVEFEHKG